MIYFLLAIAILFLMLAEKQRIVSSQLAFGACSILIFIIFAFRGPSVGGDTKEYVAFFVGGSSAYGLLNNNNLEFGFNLYVRLMRLISNSSFWFIFSSTLITIFPFFLFVKKCETSRTLSYLYILCFISFTVCIETNIRQNIAVGAFLFSLYIFLYCKRNVFRLIVCSLLVAFALLGHNTNLLVIPFFIILFFVKLSKKVSIALMAISYVTSIVTYDYLVDFFSYLNLFFSSYNQFEHFSSYGVNGFYEIENTASFNLYTLSFTLWPIMNVLACDKQEQNSIYMKSMVVSCVIYNFCCPFPIAFRIIYLFQYLSLCYIPRKIWHNKLYFCLNILFILSWLRVLLNITINVSLQNKDAHMFPYFFIWE